MEKKKNDAIVTKYFPIGDIILGIKIWGLKSWYTNFGWRGIFSWMFSFKKLPAEFNYNGYFKIITKRGFQMCLFGLQFGYINKYND